MDPINNINKSQIIPSSRKPATPKEVEVAKGRIKAHEAEDVRGKKPRARELSLPPEDRLRSIPLHEEEIKKKDGVIWKCLDRVPNKAGGNLLLYQLRPEFDSITHRPGVNLEEKKQAGKAKVNAMHPAIELLPIDLQHLRPLSKKEAQQWIESEIERGFKRAGLGKISKESPEYQEALNSCQRRLEVGRFLQKLGYQMIYAEKGVNLQVPDRDALLLNWEKLKEENPKLRDLDISSAEGIAGDLAFAIAYLLHDALLSEGVEFLHDHMAHVMPTASIVLHYALYPPDQFGQSSGNLRYKYITADVLSFYKDIVIIKREIKEGILQTSGENIALLERHLEHFEANLGAFVDTMTSASTPEGIVYSYRVKNLFFKGGGDHEKWERYMSRRFGDNPSFSEAWRVLHQLRQNYRYYYDECIKSAPKDDQSINQREAFEKCLTRLRRGNLNTEKLIIECRNIEKFNLTQKQWKTLFRAKMEKAPHSPVTFNPAVLRAILNTKPSDKLLGVMIAETDDDGIPLLGTPQGFAMLIPHMETMAPERLGSLLNRVIDSRAIPSADLFTLMNRYAICNAEDAVVELLNTPTHSFADKPPAFIDILVRAKSAEIPPPSREFFQILQKHFPEQLAQCYPNIVDEKSEQL